MTVVLIFTSLLIIENIAWKFGDTHKAFFGGETVLMAIFMRKIRAREISPD